MAQQGDSYRWQFEQLVKLREDGSRKEADELMDKLLHHGTHIFDPLANFTIEQPNHPRIAVLLELLAKLGDHRAAPILIRFLEIDIKELRLQAAISIGWLRPRAAIEKLDELEALDPEADVRRECQHALEEILQDFPKLISLCKHHKPVELKRTPIHPDSETTIARMTAVGGEERRQLVAMFPRLLAMKLRAVPLGIGAGGVVSVAVPHDVEPDPGPELKRLCGREVRLHGWPVKKIYERILTFYEWGDDDWVQFSDIVTPESLAAVRELVLSGINPDEVHAPMEDCCDSVEAAQAFLSICAGSEHKSAEIILEEQSQECTVTLSLRSGEHVLLSAPPAELRARFVTSICLLAGITDSTPRGMIRHEHTGLERPLLIIVAKTVTAGRQRLELEFVDLKVN